MREDQIQSLVGQLVLMDDAAGDTAAFPGWNRVKFYGTGFSGWMAGAPKEWCGFGACDPVVAVRCHSQTRRFDIAEPNYQTFWAVLETVTNEARHAILWMGSWGGKVFIVSDSAIYERHHWAVPWYKSWMAFGLRENQRENQTTSLMVRDDNWCRYVCCYLSAMQFE